MKSFQKVFSTSVKLLISMSMAALVLASCNDDDEIPSPRVFMELPVENQLIFSVDTVSVKATVVHEVGIEWVEVELVNSDFSPVSGNARYPMTGTNVQVELPLLLDQPLLESGTFYVAVRASDGSKVGSGFRKVLLSAIPRTLDEVVVGTRTTFNLGVWAAPPGSEWQPVLNKPIDCQGMALNYRQNILAVAGGELGNLDFHETESYSVINSLQGFGLPSLPFFLGLHYSQEFEEFSVLLREPRLRTFTKNAGALTGYELLPNHLPSRIFTALDHYFVMESPISQPNQLLVEYSRTGLRLAIYEFGGPVIGLFEKSSNELFIWENHPEGCRLRTLNLGDQLLNTIFDRTGESLIDVVRLNTNTFTFLTDEGLYRYNFMTGSTTVLGSGIAAERLFYEEMSQQYYLSNGNELTVLNASGGQEQSHTFPSEVFWVGFNYNR